MHDVSFFLLKNWLPVGVSAIVFFGIGLLLAKFIWGRHNQRLANAIEENMNLASQWSALGASQQDLFKRLRVRWQADRDTYETALAEKEARISHLGAQWKAQGGDGAALVEPPAEEVEAHKRVMELEASLAAEKAAADKLRTELDKMAELPILPFAVKGHGEAVAGAPTEDSMQTRLRELEQDLIDTHDELHKVRGDYEKQVKLVESLEAKLIAAPEAAPVADHVVAPVAESVAESVELVQLRALVALRSREMRQARETRSAGGGAGAEALASLRAEAEVLEASLRSELDAARREAEANESALAAEKADLEARVAGLSSELRERESEIARLEASVAGREAELGEAKLQLASLESVGRRKSALQAELNDVHHELYDVRRALNARIDRIGHLEARLAELSETEAKNASLELDLEGARSGLADTLRSLAEADAARAEVSLALEDLRALQASERSEAAALSGQLAEVRRELSETRLALAAKTDDYQKAIGQMDELEAIIEDRGAEVNDLSTELREQRDQVRRLRNTLAETQGELEALSEEARVLNAGAEARVRLGEEQQARIAALELSLAERYRELNRIRVEADDQSRDAKHFESKAFQLEAELERRSAEFAASDRRIASVEEALEASRAEIDRLSAELDRSGNSLGQLRDELRTLSRDKEETLRELDRATRRVAELEEAARKREEQIAELGRGLQDARARSAEFEQKAELLQAELASAREERRLSGISIAELEDALRAGDDRTLQLSHRLDEKEAEVAGLVDELNRLQVLVDAGAAAETEAQVRLSILEGELQARLAEIRRDEEASVERHVRELKLRSAEVASLREQFDEQAAQLAREIDARESSQHEIEALREKLAARAEEVRDLQNRISEVMMQRASRDMEVAVLKEKLSEMEARASETADLVAPVVDVPLSEAAPSVAESPYAVLEELPEEEGIPLDEVPGQKAHHTPQRPEPAEARGGDAPAEAFSWNAGDEEFTAFFNEGSFTLSRAEAEKVDRCARSIRRLGKRVEVHVVGYAGVEGTPDFSESLSARRADAVRERLVERGVAVGVLKVRASGQDRRFSDWKARRVELILSPVAAAETVN